MKKRIFAVMFYVLLTGLLGTELFAQQVQGFAVSGGFEGDLYSMDGLGTGIRFGGDYRFNDLISVGASLLMGADFDKTSVVELGTYFRWYFLRDEENLMRFYKWAPRFHIFVQANFGMSNVTKPKTSEFFPVFGAVAGARIVLGDFSNWNLDLYISGGYPYLVSLGVLVVYRFPLTGVYW
jgi:hypothetical protein